MEGAGEMGLLIIGNNTDHTAKGNKKKTVTADKDMNKKMDKEVRRNTCNKHLPRSHWQWMEGNCTSGQETKMSQPQLKNPETMIKTPKQFQISEENGYISIQHKKLKRLTKKAEGKKK